MNEGVVGMTRYIENIESVFERNFCTKYYKVIFDVCTFTDATLSWCNIQAKTMGISTANAMPWEKWKQLLIDMYCPRKEMHKIKKELLNLTM